MFGLMPRTGRTAVATREREPFAMLRRELASLFEFPRWPFVAWEPEPWGFEAEERENEVVLRAEMPGFEPGEIEVTLRGNELTARAEHTATEKGAEGTPATRRHACVERTVTLPEGVEPAHIEASYRNGMLEVHVPRVPEALPRRIEVK